MTSRVTDTSALIFLAKISRLELLQLGVQEVLVPSEVLAEVHAGPADVMKHIEAHLGTWLRECNASWNREVSFTRQLGKGEAAVLRQAICLNVRSVVLDDMVARKVARQLGLEPVGTLGILLAARKKGLITNLQGELESLKACGFWISTGVEREVLREAGEGVPGESC